MVILASTELQPASFFLNDAASTEIYTLSLHDALPISYGAPSRLYKEPAFATRVIPPVLVAQVGSTSVNVGATGAPCSLMILTLASTELLPDALFSQSVCGVPATRPV